MTRHIKPSHAVIEIINTELLRLEDERLKAEIAFRKTKDELDETERLLTEIHGQSNEIRHILDLITEEIRIE